MKQMQAMSAPPALSVIVMRGERGDELIREPVTEGDLIDLCAELWRECCLRQGWMNVTLEDLNIRLTPILQNGGPRCKGFILETTNPAGALAQRVFGLFSQELVAARARDRLVELNVLEKHAKYYFGLVTEPASPPAATDPADGAVIHARPQPLRYVTLPLARLRKQVTERCGPDEETGKEFPVFFTKEAFTKAERFSRKGARCEPPEETGACLIGFVGSCPDTGELFVIVTDALEVLDAQGSTVSFEYSAKSWGRLQTIIETMQRSQPALQLLGQSHGHNWLPNNGETCAECQRRPVCSQRNVFASQDDLRWMRAVFSRRPYALCSIFGLSARRDELHALYGFSGGCLVERSFFLIPGFDPDQIVNTQPKERNK